MQKSKVEKHAKVRSHFKKADPIIYEAMKDIDFDEWISPNKQKSENGMDYFSALCREVIGQQLSGKSAHAIIERFTALFDQTRIDPEKLVNMENQVLRNAGMSWAKASYIKNIAQAYMEKSVIFESFNKLNDEEVIAQLTTIKGIGPWTSEMFLIFTLGRENVFSYGDLGLKRGISYLYKIQNPGKKQIGEIVEKWNPYKTYGSITLWHSVDNKLVRL